MADDMFDALRRFHREVWAPEMKDLLDAQTTVLRNEALTNTDGLYKKFGDLETEVVMLRGAVRELEQGVTGAKERLDAVDTKLDRFALRDELNELKERADTIQQRIAEIESLLNEH